MPWLAAVGSAIGTGAAAAGSAIGTGAAAAGSAIGSAAGTVGSALGTAAESVGSGLSSAGSAIGDAFTGTGGEGVSQGAIQGPMPGGETLAPDALQGPTPSGATLDVAGETTNPGSASGQNKKNPYWEAAKTFKSNAPGRYTPPPTGNGYESGEQQQFGGQSQQYGQLMEYLKNNQG